MKGTTSGYIAIIALLIAVTTAAMFYKNKTKSGFVIISEVFNEFELKKEMAAKYEVTRNARKKILDSLQIDLSVLSRRLQSGQPSNEDKDLFERKRIDYGQKSQMFDEDNRQMSQQFDEQIVKQLNQYVADFGKEKHYDIIYGNTTNGSIMYGTDELNITKDVIAFVNSKYKGVK